jgi:hypothetical protein
MVVPVRITGMKLLAILSMLLATAQAAPPPVAEDSPLAELPKQQLPPKGCAAYLWKISGKPAMIAMATADPAQLRLSLSGTVIDLARASQQGDAGFGFSSSTAYDAGDVTATLDMKTLARGDLRDGALVTDSTLRLDRKGQDSVVLPVAGMIACS